MAASRLLGVAGCLLTASLLWAQGAWGEVALTREIAVSSENLKDQLAVPVAEMKEQLASEGCGDFSLAIWTVDPPHRLRIEVRCIAWRWDPLDPWAIGKVRPVSRKGF